MKIIILDRDGVINYDSEEYIKSPDEWQPIPKSLEAIALLNQHGYTVTIASNQSGVARGLFELNTLEKINQKMRIETAKFGGSIDSIFFCPHGPNDGCLCRKPKPGLLFDIAAHYGVQLQNVPFVGDSIRDIDTALKANAIPILVLTGNGQKTLEQHKNKLNAISVFDDLYSFAYSITHNKLIT